MHSYFGVFFLFVLMISNSLLAQDKFERESRINENEVPQKSLQFIDSCYLTTKIRWYKEEGLSNVSFESKFKKNRTLYSVEFDSLGFIEDVEIEVEWDDLEQSIKDVMASHLEKECLKYKISKVQVQFSGNEAALLSVLKGSASEASMIRKYEIIVRCKNQQKTALFEFLFNNQGQPISSSRIIFKNSSHLEY